MRDILEQARQAEERFKAKQQKFATTRESLANQPVYKLEDDLGSARTMVVAGDAIDRLFRKLDATYPLTGHKETDQFIKEVVLKPYTQAKDLVKSDIPVSARRITRPEDQQLVKKFEEGVESWRRLRPELIQDIAAKFEYDPDKFKQWYAGVSKGGKTPSLSDIMNMSGTGSQTPPQTPSQTPPQTPSQTSSGSAPGTPPPSPQPPGTETAHGQPAEDIQKEIRFLEQSKGILEQTNQDLRDRIGGPANPQVSITYERDPSRKPPTTLEEKVSQLKSEIAFLRQERDAYYQRLQRQEERQPFTLHTAPNGKIDIILEDGKALRVDLFIQAKDGSQVINPYVVAALNYRQAKEVAQTQKEAHVEGKQLSVEAEKEKEYQRQKEYEAREYRKQFLGSLTSLSKAYDKMYADFSSPGGLNLNIDPLVKVDQDIALTLYRAGVRDPGVVAIRDAIVAGKRLIPKTANGKLVFSNQRTVQYEVEGEPGKVISRPAYVPDMFLGGGS